jgi:desulfoferrodoxin-like iron-binding protein
MINTKFVFHCAVCGKVLHIYDGSLQATCCNQPMHLAFKEDDLPFRDGRTNLKDFPYKRSVEDPPHHSFMRVDCEPSQSID